MLKRSLTGSSTAVVLFFLILTGSVHAAHPLITDDAGTQGKGKFQLEVNGQYGKDTNQGIKVTTTQAAATLTYGLADPLDIILGVPYQHLTVEGSGSREKSGGMADLTAEAKWRFFEKDEMSLALKPGITLPTGDEAKDLGAGKTTYHIFFIGSREAKPWAFHLNLGYIRNDNKKDERKNMWHASLAATYDAVKNLKLVGNIGIGSNTDRTISQYPAFILGGLIYSLSETVDVDFGIKGGLTKYEPDLTLLAGLTFRF